jgi:uncharacterized membrane protein YcaP (DUF421 family)
MQLLDAKPFSDLHYFLLGEENWNYLPQVLLKCAVMFIVVVVTLRFIGRRGIMQGVFEVLTIIMLGSAAGDPMLYKNVGVLPAILIFFFIAGLYRFTDFIVARYSTAETLIEGRAVRFIKDGRFDLENFQSKELSKDELFSDMRKEGVSALGQVRTAYLEPGGSVSIFYYEDDDIRYGMPLLPELHTQKLIEIKEESIYSCSYCGHTEQLQPVKEHTCVVCKRKKWLKSIRERRVT